MAITFVFKLLSFGQTTTRTTDIFEHNPPETGPEGLKPDHVEVCGEVGKSALVD
jgi:hypothetical protein